jgi:5'-nucleotidase
LLHLLLQRGLEPGTYWNVNLPHLDPDAPDPDICFCQPCTQPLPIQYRLEGDMLHYYGEYSNRLRDRGSDVEACLSGKIAITQLRI